MIFNWVQRKVARRGSAEGRDGSVRAVQRGGRRLPGDRRHLDSGSDAAAEKRELERMALEGQVKGEIIVFQPVAILDISLAGAQIETSFALQLESIHDLRLSLGDRDVIVKGRVAYCHIGELTDVVVQYRSGVKFVEPSPPVASAIENFVAAIQNARS